MNVQNYKIIFFTLNETDPMMIDINYPLNLPLIISYIKKFEKTPLFFEIIDGQGKKIGHKYYINGIITNGEEDIELAETIREHKWDAAIKWENNQYYFPFSQGQDRNLHIF